MILTVLFFAQKSVVISVVLTETVKTDEFTYQNNPIEYKSITNFNLPLKTNLMEIIFKRNKIKISIEK